MKQTWHVTSMAPPSPSPTQSVPSRPDLRKGDTVTSGGEHGYRQPCIKSTAMLRPFKHGVGSSAQIQSNAKTQATGLRKRAEQRGTGHRRRGQVGTIKWGDRAGGEPQARATRTRKAGSRAGGW